MNMTMNEEHMACMPKTDSQRYRIGMFAAMNHITIKALRFYEEQGLLAPAYVEAENGYRYYTMSQMADVQQILALKEAGFTLEDIRQLRSAADTNRVLAKKRNEILGEIAELTARLARLDDYMGGSGMTVAAPVRVRTLPTFVASTLQERIASYDALFDLMPRMGAEMERLGCECALPEYCFTRYLEAGYREEQILVEIGEAVTEKKEDSGVICFREFPEIEAACIYHKGSYRTLPETYAVVLRYIEENNYEIVDSIRESYIDGVWNKDSEKEWLTEIQIPVRKKILQ